MNREVTPVTVEELDMADTCGCRRCMRFFVRLSPAALRQAMALVTHVLHTPLREVDEMAVDELMEWAEEASAILRATYGSRR